MFYVLLIKKYSLAVNTNTNNVRSYKVPLLQVCYAVSTFKNERFVYLKIVKHKYKTKPLSQQTPKSNQVSKKRKKEGSGLLEILSKPKKY